MNETPLEIKKTSNAYRREVLQSLAISPALVALFLGCLTAFAVEDVGTLRSLLGFQYTPHGLMLLLLSPLIVVGGEFALISERRKVRLILSDSSLTFFATGYEKVVTWESVTLFEMKLRGTNIVNISARISTTIGNRLEYHHLQVAPNVIEFLQFKLPPTVFQIHSISVDRTAPLYLFASVNGLMFLFGLIGTWVTIQFDVGF